MDAKAIVDTLKGVDGRTKVMLGKDSVRGVYKYNNQVILCTEKDIETMNVGNVKISDVTITRNASELCSALETMEDCKLVKCNSVYGRIAILVNKIMPSASETERAMII